MAQQRKQEGPCYFCGAPSTSVEHVPARMFFPEIKDAVGQRDFRQKLITVPACEAHNEDTSAIDELAALSTFHVFNTNEHAAQQVATKVKRNRTRDGDNTFAKAMSDFRHVMLGEKPGMLARVDPRMLFTHVDKVFRGLFFHETGRVFAGNMEIAALTLVDEEGWPSPLSIGFYLMLWDTMIRQPPLGANPDIFAYRQILFADGRAIMLSFYGRPMWAGLLTERRTGA